MRHADRGRRVLGHWLSMRPDLGRNLLSLFIVPTIALSTIVPGFRHRFALFRIRNLKDCGAQTQGAAARLG